jgi:enamine deaminase RidA (YjgF/YER057c/UK114 family)
MRGRFWHYSAIPNPLVWDTNSTVEEGQEVSMIKRIQPGPRMSQAVVHGNTVYLAGQVASGAPGASVAEQTRDIVGRIDRLLAEAGSDKAKLLSATVWLTDISTFAEMNGIWDAWVAPGNTPARACVEAKLAAPEFTVEIMVVAAV